MGLAISALRFLAREHMRHQFSGPVLTLGRQNVYATYAQVLSLLKEEGIEPRALPQGEPLQTNIPDWDAGQQAGFTSDRVFFISLGGLDVQALDISPCEGTDFTADLNLPIPAELEGRFGLVVDGGTLEHVFDVNQALRNVNRTLRPGGRIIHMSPASNFGEHGYYQFGPTLFYDYYGVNRFDDLRCYIVEKSPWDALGRSRMKFWQWDLGRVSRPIVASKSLFVFFCGEKTASSTVDAVPQQGQYRHASLAASSSTAETPPPNPLRSLVRRAMPPTVRGLVNRLLRRDVSVKPWGLRYLGKL